MKRSTTGFRPQGAMLRVYAALLAALGLSLCAGLLPPGGLRLAVHLGIACLMAALIAAVFMGLRSARALMRWFAVGGVMWLLFLLALTPVDYLTR